MGKKYAQTETIEVACLCLVVSVNLGVLYNWLLLAQETEGNITVSSFGLLPDCQKGAVRPIPEMSDAKPIY